MMQSERKISRENALNLIKQFAKEYRRELGKIPGEIIIVGGGSIMLNYKFRDATQDFDVILKTVSAVKDVIRRFADDNGLPDDWMNSDFIKTESYSNALAEVSQHLCTLNNGTLEIRTVNGVYLIAMKLKSHREYRNDISDAVGILIEERESGNDISITDIQEAYYKLYAVSIDDNINTMMQQICNMDLESLKAYFQKRIQDEQQVSGRILEYIDAGLNVNTRNVREVVAKIKEKMNNQHT